MQHGKQNTKRIWRRGLDGVSGQSETLELVSGLVGKKKAGRQGLTKSSWHTKEV